MTIYPGRGAVGLKQSYPAYRAIASGSQIGVGRWNDDGAPDTLIRTGPRLTLYPGNGPGGLSSPSRLQVDLAPYDWAIGVSDLTLTGHPDLLVRQKGDGPALRPARHADGAPRSRLSRLRAGRLRPGGLTGVEACRDALVDRDLLASLLGHVGDQDHGTAASQRFGEGSETGRGSRAGFREEAAAVGEMAPDGGRSPQLLLGEARAAASSSAGAGHATYASGCDQTSTPRSWTSAGRGSANRPARGWRAVATTGMRGASAAQRSTPSGPVTTPSAGPSHTTSSPPAHAAPSTTGASQCAGRSTCSRLPCSISSSSTSSEATFATQFAYVVTDSSVRSPVASS